MRRASYSAILCTAICAYWAAVIHAQQVAADAVQPAPAAVAAEPAAKPAVDVKPTVVAAEASAKPGAVVKPAAIVERAQALAKMRQKEQGGGLCIGDICQVKHYKQDTLQGFGLVLDLGAIATREEGAGTTAEETAPATAKRLTELLALLDARVGEGDVQSTVPEQFRDTDQISLAAVTATVPPEGVCQGDRIDCEVTPLGGKSLQDGYLLVTPLSLPGPRKEAPVALAAGPIVKESYVRSGPAKIPAGCLVEADVADQFVKDGKITLILDEEHADFLVAQGIVDLVNTEMGVAMNQPLAKAPNRYNVEVTVPETFADDPVAFVTLVLKLQTQIPADEKQSRD